MKKTDASGESYTASQDLRLVQFKCPAELKQWAQWYADKVRYTDLTSWLIEVMVEQKIAYEREARDNGQLTSIAEIQAKARSSHASRTTRKTPHSQTPAE